MEKFSATMEQVHTVKKYRAYYKEYKDYNSKIKELNNKDKQSRTPSS